MALQVQGPAGTLYTVPAGSEAVVRFINIRNPGNILDAVHVWLSIGVDAPETRILDGREIFNRFHDTHPKTYGVGFVEFCEIAMAAGEVIQGYTDYLAGVIIVIGGDEDEAV